MVLESSVGRREPNLAAAHPCWVWGSLLQNYTWVLFHCKVITALCEEAWEQAETGAAIHKVGTVVQN